MQYIIIILLIVAIVIMYFYYEKKLALIKKRLLTTSNQFYNIRNQYRNSFSKLENVNIRFLTPPIKTAITNKNIDVFLAPLQNSPKLKKLEVKMEVNILDSAIINNTLWYYVDLPIDSQYNCRGWIKDSDFISLHSEIKEIECN